MKQRLLLILTLCCLQGMVMAQVQWRDMTTRSEDISWNNYSTSYVEPGDPHKPILVTAIPYAGKYDIDNTPIEMSFSGSLYRYQSMLSDVTRQLVTYDSSAVYFMAPGIHVDNAAQYEFQVVQDSATIVAPWQCITTFTEDDFKLNNFETKMGWLGGYKTTWGHFLTALLRKKGDTAILSAAVVYWKSIKPVLETVYTSATMVDFVANSKFSPSGKKGHVPPLIPDMVLDNKERNAIFFLAGEIIDRKALEYQLLRDGDIYRPWGSNEADNNTIWLKDLPKGKYVLEMRFSGQRHNVSTYAFSVAPAWYQTTRFKLLTGIVLVILLACILLLVKVTRQRRKITLEQLKKAKLQLALQSVYAQLNPHFVFNALHSIQGLVNKNDIAGANRYLGAFGNLMRDSLAGNHKEMIALSQELRSLGTYLELEQLRFGFHYAIDVDNNINAYETEIPSLFLQPLLENAVKHGVGDLAERGRITVHIARNNKNMEVQITDNGHGFDTAAVASGYGLRLTRERAALLNDLQQDQRIEVSLHSVPEKGTTATVLFKNWLA